MSGEIRKPTGNARWGGGGDSPTPAGFTEKKAREAAALNGIDLATYFRSLHHIFDKMSPRWLLEWVSSNEEAPMAESFEDRWQAVNAKLKDVMQEFLALAVEKYGPTGKVPYADHTTRLHGMTAFPEEFIKGSEVRGITFGAEGEPVAKLPVAPHVFMPWPEYNLAHAVLQESRHVEKVHGPEGKVKELVPGPTVFVVAGIVCEDK